MDVKIFNSAKEACTAVAKLLAVKAIEGGNIAVSGGSTPKLLFQIIGEEYKNTDWSRLNFFWVDERMVPENDRESNYGEFFRTLLIQGVISEKNVFPVWYYQDELRSLAEYTLTIRNKLPFENELPHFDLILLGMGEDGHTASIFPGNLSSFTSEHFVERAIHPQTKQHRITLTGSAINNAEQVIFLVTGESKTEILKKVILEKDAKLPAAHVNPVSGNLVYFLGGIGNAII
ncbi:MAG: 6-phosphogluconolactonase [Tannerella sp.]|jgi:6-phosphogluconolactonase|nr:6-phosphogluconolactonase [Tannerella sp.]